MSSPRGLSSRTPLRVKLVAGVVLLAGLGLLASGVAATTALRNYLLARVDTQLRSAVRDPGQLNALLDQGTGGRGGRGPRGPSSIGTVYVRFAANASPLPDDVPAPRIPATDRTADRPFTVPAVRGATRWRVIQGPVFDRSTGTTGVLSIAVPLDEVQRTLVRLVKIEAVVGLAVLLLLGLGGLLLVRRNLRPLLEVERTAELIAAGDLTRRVPESDPRTEVGSLSQSFNAMLGQVESAFQARATSETQARASEERMRRFVADASHELRTPLTSIRGFAELYRQGALPARPDVDRAMGRVESEAARMGLLVEDLLLLARLDQQRPLEQAPVDLLELAGDAVADARATAPSRSIQLAADSLSAEPLVIGDAGRLRQVLGNLLTNALVHTPDGSPVVVRVRTTPFDAFLEVADSGPGISVADQPKVFERFFRADASRTRTHGGSGLGLSIVAALVAAHGGAVEVVETPGGGATFRVRLPLPSTGSGARVPPAGSGATVPPAGSGATVPPAGSASTPVRFAESASTPPPPPGSSSTPALSAESASSAALSAKSASTPAPPAESASSAALSAKSASTPAPPAGSAPPGPAGPPAHPTPPGPAGSPAHPAPPGPAGPPAHPAPAAGSASARALSAGRPPR